LRSDSRQNPNKGSSKDRILKCINEKRKKELSLFSTDSVIEKTYWLELISILGHEWSIFETILGDKGRLSKSMDHLNDRPYAHAKDLDPIEIVASKNALKYIEDLIFKYENA
jgi:hypothetical protein